ncbi:MAG: DUF1223 domain-containing protein [Sphingomonadaceae bacterium]|nr:DUF1223 domain-containing protein [Sphingomonadaceae bacterium]
MTARAVLLPLLAVLAGAAIFFAAGPRASAPQAAPTRTAAAPLHPVVVELFTAQGCSSCPPADAALDRLSHDPGIVAISRPVTYWDALGWRDTLARQANTDLQRAYAARRHSDEVYTPQAVVQGQVLLVGGRTGAIHRAIDESAARPGPGLRILGGAGGRTLVLEGAASRPAEIRLVAMRARVPVAIGRGENSGHIIDYVNVVVADDVIGAWHGGPLRLPLPAARLHVPTADRYAIIVQEPNAGAILAASYL